MEFFEKYIDIIFSSLWVIIILIFFFHSPLIANPFKSNLAYTGTTLGKIIVDSPEVYSRERLVNDRFNQNEWLEDQLILLEEESLFWPSAMIETSAANSLKMGLDIGSKNPENENNPTGGNSRKPPNKKGAENPNNGNNGQEKKPETFPRSSPIDLFRIKKAFRNEIRNELLENQLDDRHDLDGNTLYRLKFDASVIPEGDTDSFAIVMVEISHIENTKDTKDLYKKWMEHIEHQLNQALLDITSGLPGFYLDPPEINRVFNFASDSMSSTSKNKSNIFEIYKNLLTSQISKKENQSRIDAAKEYESKFKTNCAKEFAEEVNLKKDELSEIDKTKNPEEYKQIFKESLNLNLTKEKKKIITACVERENHKEQMTPKDEATLINNCFGEEDKNKCILKIKTDFKINRACREQVKKDPGMDPSKEQFYEANFQDCIQVKTNISKLFNEVYLIFKEEKKENKENKEFTLESPDQESFPTELVTKSFNKYVKYHYSMFIDNLLELKVTGCQFGHCRLATKEPPIDKEKGFDAFKSKIFDDLRLYSYSVTPKNFSQQISIKSLVEETNQIAFSAGVNIKEKGLRAGLDDYRQRQSDLQHIKNKPLVVGINNLMELLAPDAKEQQDNNAETTQKTAQTNAQMLGDKSTQSSTAKADNNEKNPSKNETTTFGWLIGPKFQGNNNGNINFRHIPIQVGLSATISVPSWLKGMNVEVYTCWVPPIKKGKYNFFERCETKFKNKHEDENFKVKLPGTVTDIASKLGDQIVRSPRVVYQLEPTTIVAKKPVSIIIEGDNLWRSPRVTIGSQISKRITVLPNMKGIIAEFDEIKVSHQHYIPAPPSNSPSTNQETMVQLPITVWTSEGKALVGIAFVYPSEEMMKARIENFNQAQKTPPGGEGKASVGIALIYPSEEMMKEAIKRQKQLDAKDYVEGRNGTTGSGKNDAKGSNTAGVKDQPPKDLKAKQSAPAG